MIQPKRTLMKMMMNFQLPPNAASRSARRWPSVRFSSNSMLTFRVRTSPSRRLSMTSASITDRSPFSDSRTPWTYCAR